MKHGSDQNATANGHLQKLSIVVQVPSRLSNDAHQPEYDPEGFKGVVPKLTHEKRHNNVLRSVAGTLHFASLVYLVISTASSAAAPSHHLRLHHLRGLDNFDEWHFELTTIVLQGEGLTTQATQCAGVDAKWFIKELTRASRVLDADTRKLRRHIDDEVLHPSSEPPLPPPVLDDVEPKLIDPMMEYLTEHRLVKFLEARAAKASLEELIKTEHADVERSIALVYASLSESVRRNAAAANLVPCAHCIIEWPRGKFCS
ncbi:hypothetical protein H257_12462 [Aphanomyces astaci]|uniref:Uncharacterized protein n=1 Tax=Aphanomyces astaci TaxID=112090 RepID=W4FXS3_APHAT|nr:hypothetical protein H257_12462 [Aphanomyces astaci]ETV72292.1 hypothetical protein H257_12462 [Aphanomyces astaci]|eukprot:XP_009837974.1 hypothetical protein H257_12462 [Aphanomyces astaci]